MKTNPAFRRSLAATLAAFLMPLASWAAPAITVEITTPKAEYKLNDKVPITINVSNGARSASGNDSAANAANNARNTARGFRVDTFVLTGVDIYGNRVEYFIPGPFIGDLGPEESKSQNFDFEIPNDGTLHNLDDAYFFRGNYSFFDPDNNVVQRRSANTDANVKIGVIPDLRLVNITFSPGSYRGGDIIRLTARVLNKIGGEPNRQGRPLRPSVADQYRLDTRLTIAPAFGQTPGNEFQLYFQDFLGDLAGTPDAGTVIREVRVIDTPAPPPGYGVLRTAQGAITTDANGRVTGIVVTDGGNGFVNGEAILVQAAQVTGGTPFQGTAVVANGQLTAVTLPNPNTSGGYLPSTTQAVTLINRNGRNYNPQPYDGFLDLGEQMEMVIDVRLPDNFPATYYIAGQVDSLNTITEPRPNDTTVPYPDTVDGGGAPRLVNNNTFVSRDATRIILQAGGYPSTALLSGTPGTVAAPGVAGNNFSDQAVVSASGEWVAFLSSASNLLGTSGQPTNGKKQIFARQPATGETVLVSASAAGTQGNQDSSDPAISSDGRFVAFASESTNLADGDLNNSSDIFVRDLTNSGLSDKGGIVRVSVNADGVEGNGGSFNPSLSANGRFVAFESEARNLDKTRVLNGGSGSTLVYVHDRAVDGKLPYDRPGNTVTRLVSVTSRNIPANGFSSFARISGSGNSVAFTSYAPNLNSGSSNVQQVYRISLVNGAPQPPTLVLVSQTSIGQPGNEQSYQPSISADGNQIAFTSDADSLVAGDTNLVPDVFVRDLSAGRTVRVSVSDPRRAWGTISFVAPLARRGLAPANNPVANSSITISDGVRTVRFVFGRTAAETATTRNVPIGLNGGQTRDNLVQAIRLSSLDVDAFATTPPPAGLANPFGPKASYTPSIYIAAITTGTIANRAITTDSAVLLVSGLSGGGTQATDPGTLPGSDPGSITPSISGDGRYVAFRSVARDLAVFEQASGQFAQGFKNGDLLRPQIGAFADIYVHDRRADGKGAFDRAGNTSTELVSVSTFGDNTSALLDVQSSGVNQSPSISADGQFVTFSSDSENTGGLVFGPSNLVPLDTNGFRDVYLRNRNLGGSQPPSPPQNLPTIAFSSPIKDSVSYVTGTVVPLSVDATAAAGKSIRQVEFSVNGTTLATLTEAPYYSTYRLPAPGTYKIVATVTDNLGVQRQTFATVTSAPAIVDAPTLSVTHPTPGGAGDTANDFSDSSSFYLNALAVAGSGASLDFVLGANVDSGGAGYKSAPTVTFTGGGGSEATGVARIAGGRVVGIDITNPGKGYRSVPSVVFAGGGGSGAKATAFLNTPIFFANGRLLGGTVDEINVTAGGGGYTSAPVVRVVGGGGSGATARAVVSGGRVTAVQITNGGRGYSTMPTIAFSGGGGSGASARVQLSPPVTRLGDIYGINWRPDSTGTVQITAQVSDSRGNTVVSTPLSFTIDPQLRPLPTLKMENISSAVTPKAGSQVLLEASYTANSPTPISRVDFYANQVYIGAWEPAAGEQFKGVASLVWIPEVEGSYRIAARTIQVLGEPGDNSVVSSNEVTLTVRPKTPDVGSPPVVLLSDPVSEPRLARGSSVYINVTATDPDGTIADNGVRIFIDGQLQSGVRRYGNTWSLRWTPSENGRFYVTASAVDNNGNAVALPRTQFEVAQALNLLPQARFDQVVGGSTLSQNSPVTLRASARFFNTRNDSRVDFYANGALIGTGLPDATAGPDGFRGYSLVWTPPSIGRGIRFSAKAVSVNYTTQVDNDNIITTHGSAVSVESQSFDVNGISGNTQNQRFVRDIYPKILGRAATFAEWDFYVKQLDAKRMDQADVVIALMDYRARTLMFGYDSEYGRGRAMAFAAYGRLGIAPNNDLIRAFLSAVASDTTSLPLTSYNNVTGAPYGATVGLGKAMQEIFLGARFTSKNPTAMSLNNLQFVDWLNKNMFPGYLLGKTAPVVTMMADPSLALSRQGAAAAFFLRFVGAAAMQDARYNRTAESLFQRRISSTALQFMLSDGKTWSVPYGVANPYSKTVVQNLLKQYPVGVVAAPVARTAAGSSASYHGTVSRAPLNGDGGGAVSVLVSAANVATGTITMNGSALVFRTVAGPDGKFAGVTDAVPGEPGYRVDLQILDAGLPTARITGRVESGTQVATIAAAASPWGSGKPATAYAGTYNVRFVETPAKVVANVPVGPREARVQVLSSGVVNIVGQLAKGVPFSWSGRLGGDGSVPIYAAIPNRGSILGTLSLKKGTGATMVPSGSLIWQSPKTSATAGSFRQVLAVQPR